MDIKRKGFGGVINKVIGHHFGQGFWGSFGWRKSHGLPKELVIMAWESSPKRFGRIGGI